jgi:hypothetical protein
MKINLAFTGECWARSLVNTFWAGLYYTKASIYPATWRALLKGKRSGVKEVAL